MKGWSRAGTHPEQYAHGIAGERFEAARVGFLRFADREKPPAGFGTLMQMVTPDDYRGARVRFSAAVRSDGIDGWAGLWLRVDSTEPGRPVGFDNMRDRAVVGTQAWGRHHIVLDVPDGAAAIGLGVLLAGRGELRFADLRFEQVPKDVPLTAPAYPRRPVNLDLSED